MMRIDKITYKGLNAIRIMDKDVEVIILPEWGSKIVGLFDKRKKKD